MKMKKILSLQSRCYSNLNYKPDYSLHIPVMLNEILKHLVDEAPDCKTYLDMTFGAGGHSTAILERNPNSNLICMDRDPTAIGLGKQLANKYPGRVKILHGKFSDLKELLDKSYLNKIDAALIDCGVSSIQFDTAARGFSLSKDGQLDMRMDGSKTIGSITARDVVNKLDEDSLDRIIWKYGEERLHKKIAHGIVYFRNAHGPIETTKQLADLIDMIVKSQRFDSMNRPSHAATKTFQAIRIFVNNELNELYNGINQLHSFLRPGGRLAVISFHSLEDRIVKSHFNEINLIADQSAEVDNNSSRSSKKRRIKFKFNQISGSENEKLFQNLWTPLSRKVILPTEEEIEKNPRARSAKLRIAIKNQVQSI